jgi:hypothetical protein
VAGALVCIDMLEGGFRWHCDLGPWNWPLKQAATLERARVGIPVNSLFYVDITAGIVHQYDPSRAKSRPFSRGRVTGGLTIQEDGSLLLFQDGRISGLGLDGVQREVASVFVPKTSDLTKLSQILKAAFMPAPWAGTVDCFVSIPTDALLSCWMD